MTDDERSAKGYKAYQSIRKKLDSGAIFKNEQSASFFSDQIPRFNKRHEKTYLSIGQLIWLQRINKGGLTKGKKL
jgi:hypothetical protein